MRLCTFDVCLCICLIQVSTYIQPLSRYSPDFWGVGLCTIDGQRHSIGDTEVPFTLQSSGKPINYALAINEHGAEVVHQYVGWEPSGETFASIKLDKVTSSWVRYNEGMCQGDRVR